MLFGELAANRKFQIVNPQGTALSDPFISRGNGLAIDQTYALYQFPDEMPVREVVEVEQPKEQD